jgi:hypothetical protein
LRQATALRRAGVACKLRDSDTINHVDGADLFADRPHATPLRLRRLLVAQKLEESTNFVTVLSWMSHPVLAVDDVLVTTPDASSLDVPSVDEIGNDPLGGTLRDSDMGSNVAESNVGVLRDP